MRLHNAILAVSGCLLCAALAAANAGDAASGRRWRGVFEPRQEAVIPSEISMRVRHMPKRPGESCREGETLVEFDATMARAAYQAAAAKARAAELNATGLGNLFQRNQVTAVEVARAESELAQARLELAAAERDARACVVVAPFSGKIVERKVREHEWADRGGPLLLLVDDAVLRARFFLPEALFQNIRLGDRVRVEVPAVSREMWGEVSRLGVMFDPVSRTFDVWADVVNDRDDLRSGMTAEIEWPAAKEAE